MPLKRASIKDKLTGLSILTSSLALLLACSGFFAFDLLTFRTNMVRNLITQAEIVGFNSASALLFHDTDSATKTLSALNARPAMLAAALYNPDGRPFVVWKSPETKRRIGRLSAVGPAANSNDAPLRFLFAALVSTHHLRRRQHRNGLHPIESRGFKKSAEALRRDHADRFPAVFIDHPFRFAAAWE